MGRVGHEQIRVGGRWSSTARTHRGQIVEVVAIRSRTVRVRPVGAWSKSQRNNRWTVPVDHFLAGHAPVRAI